MHQVRDMCDGVPGCGRDRQVPRAEVRGTSGGPAAPALEGRGAKGRPRQRPLGAHRRSRWSPRPRPLGRLFSGCRACNMACPTGVRIAEINARAAPSSARPRVGWRKRPRNNLLARPELLGSAGYPVGRLVNATFENRFAALADGLLDIDRRRRSATRVSGSPLGTAGTNRSRRRGGGWPTTAGYAAAWYEARMAGLDRRPRAARVQGGRARAELLWSAAPLQRCVPRRPQSTTVETSEKLIGLAKQGQPNCRHLDLAVAR